MRPISMPVRDEYFVEVVYFFGSNDLPLLMSICAVAYPGGMCTTTNVILRRLINMALFVDYKQLDLF